MSLLGRKRARSLRDRLLIAQDKLGAAAVTIVATPGRCRLVTEALRETAALLQAANQSNELGCPREEADALLADVRARMFDLHQLLEAALEFQCGTLLSHPAAEITYTAEGGVIRTAAGFRLTMHA